MTAQGVSFRHAVELLLAQSPALGTLAAVSPLSSGGPVKRSTARKLGPIAAADLPTRRPDAPPVLADLLGLSNTTATRWATLAARDWSRYAAMRRDIETPAR